MTVLTDSTDVNQILGEDRRQKERFTVRLKSLIRNYPEGVTILKELLQNADDAGAKSLVLTVDWRDRRAFATPGIEHKLREWLGPALLAWNDSTFSERDFEAISHVGESSKTDDIAKTGRFGVGFNAVYNITDFPCFVSGNRVMFFDPHERHITSGNASTFGVEGQTPDLWTRHLPTLARALAAGGFTVNAATGAFDGTLFRFPLRLPEHAAQSEIKSEAFNREAFERLLDAFATDGEQLLLFLKNTTSIEVREITHNDPETGEPVVRPRLLVQTDNADEVTSARSALTAATRQIAEQCRTRPQTLPVACYQHETTTTTWATAQPDAAADAADAPPRETTSRWRVVNGFCADEKGEIARGMRQMADSGNKALPWGGAAARLSTSDPDAALVAGRAFCFLPLPQGAATGLPVHLHGFFDLDDARTNLTVPDTSLTETARRVRGEWNRVLVLHTIAPIYARLIEELKQDVGERDTAAYYALWPVKQKQSTVKVLEDLPAQVLHLLRQSAVIRVQGAKAWSVPPAVRTLKPEFANLAEPLSLLGFPIPDGRLTFDQIALQRLGIEALKPEVVRNNVVQPKYTDCAGALPRDAPQAALSKPDWIAGLLRFCLSDGSSSVLNLPLALRVDHKIAVFDGETLFDADDDVRGIFVGARPAWFVASDYSKIVPELGRATQGLPWFGPQIVAAKLHELYPAAAKTSGEKWEPTGVAIPNAAWLTRVYRYLAKLAPDRLTPAQWQQLRLIPLVPGTDLRLYTGGNPRTPLMADRTLTDSARQALKIFKVRLLGEGRSPELGEAIKAYTNKRYDESLILHTSAGAVLDAVHARRDEWSKTPPSPADTDALLDFLADRHSEIRDDTERLHKLKSLPLFRVKGRNERVAATSANLYMMATTYRPPDIASDASDATLLCDLGGEEKWRPLLSLLGIRPLDGVHILQNLLLPHYKTFSPAGQKNALIWIRENLDKAQNDLRNQRGPTATNLKELVSKASLIRCRDGKLRAAVDVYDPASHWVEQILNNTAPAPDFAGAYKEMHKDDASAWREFFARLGWRTEPAPQDLLNRVDHLIIEAQTRGMASVEPGLRAVFEYVADAERFRSHFARATVSDKGTGRPFTEALASRAWIPVQRAEQYLKAYPAARVPDNQLHLPRYTTFVQNANQAGSQLSLFLVSNTIASDVQAALGFPAPSSGAMNQAVLAHLEAFCKHFAALPDTERTARLAETVYKPLYRYLHDHIASQPEKYGNLKLRFADVACLWDGSRFWTPSKCFAVRTEMFGSRRGSANGGERANVYQMLGQPIAPSVDDCVSFLEELQDEYVDEPLRVDDANLVIKVARHLEKETDDARQNGASAGRLYNVPLLSDDNRLLPATSLLINDDPHRADYIQKQNKCIDGGAIASAVALLHKSMGSGALAQWVGCLSLRDDVTEKLSGSAPLVASSTPDSIRWSERLQSDAFCHAVSRLARDKDREEALPSDVSARLQKTTVQVADNLTVDLSVDVRRGNGRLDSVVVARAVSTNFYRDHYAALIYVRRDTDEEMMRARCAEALNRDVLEGVLEDLSKLEKLLKLAPEEYESYLNKCRVRSLRDDAAADDAAQEQTGDQNVPAPLDFSDNGDDQTEPWQTSQETSDALADSLAKSARAESSNRESAVGADANSGSDADRDDAEDDVDPFALPVPDQAEDNGARQPQGSPALGATPFPSRVNGGDAGGGASAASQWKSDQGVKNNNGASSGGRAAAQRGDKSDNDADSNGATIPPRHHALGDHEAPQNEAQPGASREETVALPEAHAPYDGQVHERTPMRSFDDDLIRRRHPQANIITAPTAPVGSVGGAGKRERIAPGYTGPQDAVSGGDIALTTQSRRNAVLLLTSPKPAALFQPDDATRGEDGASFFPALLLGEESDTEPLRLFVDFNKDVLYFRGNDRDRVTTFLEARDLHAGCLLTIRLLENGTYRIGYENEPTTIKPVPLLGLDENNAPIVEWSDDGITLPCPVNSRLFLAQRRFADDEARDALWRMAENAPDLLEALQRLLEGRAVPLSVDDLYRLNFHIRPVSYGYFRYLIEVNTGQNRLFHQAMDEGVLLNPSLVTEIIRPSMTSSNERRYAVPSSAWEAIEAALKDALTGLLSSPGYSVEDQAAWLILILKEAWNGQSGLNPE